MPVFTWARLEKLTLTDASVPVEPYSDDFMVKLQGVLKNPNGMYPALSWPDQPGTLANLGDTFKFTPAAGAAGTFDRGTTGGGVFDLLQWHIHTPSEHRINGLDYPAEIHCE